MESTMVAEGWTHHGALRPTLQACEVEGLSAAGAAAVAGAAHIWRGEGRR
jgi:hypothetical protein